MIRNLVGSIYGRSSIKSTHLVPIPLTNMATTGDSCFWLVNQPIRNKSRLWRPCLLTDRDEMSNVYKGPSIDASYQVSVYLDEGFQTRRLNCEKLMDDWRRTSSDDKSSHCLWQGELIIREMWSSYMKHLLKVLYQDCSFRPDPLTNMATTGNSCFWLVDF
jgi:hypothetical protein